MAEKDESLSSGSQTVSRAIKLLRLIACGQERGVRLVDLERMSGLSRPTVHRLLKTLVNEEAVVQDPETRRYLIGQEVTLLGLARTRKFPLLGMADPFMAELAERVNDTVFLSIRHGHDSICIGRKTGTHPIQVLSIEVGSRRPLGIGVSGVAILSSLSTEECEKLTVENEPRLIVNKTQVSDVLARVANARHRGYAHATYGIMPGTSAIAVPVITVTGLPLGAITVTAMAERLNKDRLDMVVPAMQYAAKNIARRYAQVNGKE